MSSDKAKLYGLLVDWTELVANGMPDEDLVFGLRPLNARFITLEERVFGKTSDVLRSPGAMAYHYVRNALLGYVRGEDKAPRAARAAELLSVIPPPEDYIKGYDYVGETKLPR